MSLELDVQKEINVLRDTVKSTVYTNLVKASKAGRVSLDLKQVTDIRSLIESSINQAFTNGRSGVSKAISHYVSKV